MKRPSAYVVRSALLLGALLPGLLGCEQPNPLQQAELIGEYPQWGQNFAKEPQDLQGTGSMMMAGQEGRLPTGPDGTPQEGGSAVPSANPMAGEKWGGGTAEAGRGVFLSKCAMCHGENGAGGQRMGLDVPTLRNAEWHAKVDDNYIGLTIAHGKGGAGKMPAFIGQLSREQINDVIAHVRTLRDAPPAPKKEGGEEEGGFGEGW